MKWVQTDGGRHNYFKGRTGDCVTRAVAIARIKDYKEVYDDFAFLNKMYYMCRANECLAGMRDRRYYNAYKKRAIESAHNGVNFDVLKEYMYRHGYEYYKAEHEWWCIKDCVWEGTNVILCTPYRSKGKHLVTVKNNVLFDDWDSRDCLVLGFWKKRKVGGKIVEHNIIENTLSQFFKGSDFYGYFSEYSNEYKSVSEVARDYVKLSDVLDRCNNLNDLYQLIESLVDDYMVDGIREAINILYEQCDDLCWYEHFEDIVRDTFDIDRYNEGVLRYVDIDEFLQDYEEDNYVFYGFGDGVYTMSRRW